MKEVIHKLNYIDLCCLKFINLKLKCKPLDYIMIVLTYLGSFFFAIMLITFFLLIPKFQQLGKQLATSLLVSNIVVLLLKFLTKRTRPFIKYDFLHVKTIGVDKISSYPSGHTNIAFSIMTTLLIFLRIHYAFLIVPLLVGVSRVYLGVHYPSDIITGMFIGALSPIIIHLT